MDQLEQQLQQLSLEGKAAIDFSSFAGKTLKLNNEQDVSEIIQQLQQLINDNPSDPFHIKLSGNTIGVDAAKELAQTIQTINHLQHVDLSDIFTGRLIEEVPPALTHLVQSLIDKQHLHTVDLSHNAFGPAGTRAFVELIMNNHCIKTLKVINNGLGIGGGTIIAQSLVEALDKNNNHNNNNHNNNNNSSSKPSIETFEAGRNRLENNGATELAMAFQKMGTLTSLHLPQNGIRPEGITALANAISVNSENFTELNLSDNTIKVDGAQSIANAIRSMHRLKHLNLGDCLLGTEGGILIAEAIEQGHEQLEHVDLVFNEMGDEAAYALIKALSNKKQLKRVELNGNEFSAKVLAALEESSLGELLGTMSDNEGDEDDDDDDDAEDDE